MEDEIPLQAKACGSFLSTRMNTYLNILQNGLFVVNTPDKSLLPKLDIIAYPYRRQFLEDKIEKAGLTMLSPFVLPSSYSAYPPLIKECLAHLECIVVDIHRPNGSDHYIVTGRVIGASYDESLGDNIDDNIDDFRNRLVERIFHHFGSSVNDRSARFIGKVIPISVHTITFELENKPSDG